MVEIGGKPILWHIMRHYLRHGFDHFVLALGYKGEVIKRYIIDYYMYNDSNLTVDMHNGSVKPVKTTEPVSESWTVDLIETGPATETGARVKRIAPHLGNETFMLTYGDGVSDVNLSELVEFHRAHGKLATMTAVHPPTRYGKVDLDGPEVRRFTEKPQFAGEHGPKVGEGWINGGFFVLEPGIFDYIDDDELTKLRRDDIGFIDFDGFSHAEPALDVGHFVAYLRLAILKAELRKDLTPEERMRVLDEIRDVKQRVNQLVTLVVGAILLEVFTRLLGVGM
jgi:glucose-1-phosphate cytidylyltransferase